jgi:ectoine hydroxylase-related dioxygenase (phytanoyl-CoA dioxygenase family)
MQKNFFIDNGYLEFKNLLNKAQCKKLNNEILRIRKIDKKIFFKTKNEYQKNKNKKINSKNILDKFNLNFILQNKKFKNKIENILGKEYFVYASRIICALPHKFLPKWINSQMDTGQPNLGNFIKHKFRDMRYFHGIDYHMDLVDFSRERSNFITVYIYLDDVTKKMSPLNILPKTHLGGADSYPHNLKKKKNKIIYKTDIKKNIITKNKVLTGSAGDTWLWHGCLLHGTNFNVQGDAPRLSLRLILRQKNTLMDDLNFKIGNTVALKKMKKTKGYSNKKTNINKNFLK